MQLQLFIAQSHDEADKWVSRLNRLSAEMDETAATLHPSAWSEALAPLNEKWKKEARS